MTPTLWMALLFVACIVVCALLIVRMLLDSRQRIIVTVARPTTTDGEQVQLTANLATSLGAKGVTDQIEKMSLAIQGRMMNQNEMVLQTQVKNAHATWIRVKQKIDAGGKLSHAEANFWSKVGEMFDAKGIKEHTTESQVLAATESLNK